MLIFLLSYLGGVLTIFSPCVLPVLPFVFAKSDQSFRRSGLPILLGMTITFTLLASFAAVGGAYLVSINQYGRYAAMLLLLVLGIALIFPAFSERLMRPFVALGGRLQQQADSKKSLKGALLLGVAIGFLWAPCAGPILGLVLAGAALNGANLHSAGLLLAFAAGAATSLGLALLAGARVFRLMKRGLGAEEWVRRGLGIAVVTGVVVIALGWDSRFLAQFDFLNTVATEQKLLSKLDKPVATVNTQMPDMPPLTGADEWLNSPPLNTESLRGKVVLVDFWTYSCINCLRTLPYLKAWNEKYRAQGLVIIGVHALEFAFEKDAHNVAQAVRELGLTYPVAIDNHYAIWNAFKNQYWPAHYLIDTRGVIREHHFGEGGYAQTEQMIQTLLKEAHQGLLTVNDKLVQVSGSGATAAATDNPRSPETYLGYARAQNMAGTVKRNQPANYRTADTLKIDHWALAGKWRITADSASSQASGDAISYHFQGRDLHLVMGANVHGNVKTPKNSNAIRFRVTLDGVAPGKNHGVDTDEAGLGVLHEQRLYQLIRLNGPIKERTFRIEFLEPGAQAFAFTFG